MTVWIILQKYVGMTYAIEAFEDGDMAHRRLKELESEHGKQRKQDGEMAMKSLCYGILELHSTNLRGSR